MRDLGEQR